MPIDIAIQGWTTLTHQHYHIDITTRSGFKNLIPITIPILDHMTRLGYPESWNEAHLKTELLNKISTIIRKQAKLNSPAEYATEIEAAITEILLSAITNLTGSQNADRPMLALITWASKHRTAPSAPPHPVSPSVVSNPQPKASLAKTEPPKIPMTAVALPRLVPRSDLPGAVEAVEPPNLHDSSIPSWDTLAVAATMTKTRPLSQVDRMVTPP